MSAFFETDSRDFSQYFNVIKILYEEFDNRGFMREKEIDNCLEAKMRIKEKERGGSSRESHEYLFVDKNKCLTSLSD